MNKKLDYLLIGIVAMAVISCSTPRFSIESSTKSSTNPHLLYESDPIEDYLVYDGFLIQFDTLRKIPKYTIHRIDPIQLKDSNGVRASRNESPDFKIDPRIIQYSAVRSDYYQSGYDRGHHVPAGDFVYSQCLKNETFNYGNVSPQLKELNRYGWKYLEEAIRKKVLACNCEAFVITGTLFNETYNSIGKNKVGVPDQLYKIAFYPRLGKIYAFLMNNSSEEYRPPFSNYQLTVDQLEKETGCDFFERLTDEDETKLESKIKKFKK